MPENYNLKRLINSRGELFRRGVQEHRLEEWKNKMTSAFTSRSSWIRAMGDELKQIEAIRELTTDDVFRSQFRTAKAAEKSPIEIIDWGLQHIERLRRANMETTEQYAKSKEVRWIFFVSLISALISALALFTK